MFFTSTNYLETLNSASSSDHFCTFDEIKCDISNKFIKEINFINTSLSGSLNTNISLLESLTKIDLSDTQMRGSIDGEIFNKKLTNLEIFDVNSNIFEGEIPTLLSSLSSLIRMKLDQ